MYDIFISHSHKDAEYAQAIAALMENYGFLVWWDKNLLPGEKYRAKIETLINQCPAVISLWSPNSIESDWVMDEADRAAGCHKLIPIRIADCSLPMGFREIECHSLLNWSGSSPTDDIEPLIQAVEDRVGHSRGTPQHARLPREIRAIAERVFFPIS